MAVPLTHETGNRRWGATCAYAAADAYQTARHSVVPAEVCQQGDQHKGNMVVKTG